MKGRARIQLGQTGEELAEAYLREQGYQIVARNFRTRQGEIDRIARDERTLVFVEVKTRRTLAFGVPAESVTWQKQQKLRQTALAFLQQYGSMGDMIRFDVISIHMHGPNHELIDVEHVKSAF